MAHSSLGRGGQSSDEAHDGLILFVVLLDPLGSHFLVLASDFTDHDDAFGLGVDHELLEDIDEVGSVEGVTSDTHDG